MSTPLKNYKDFGVLMFAIIGDYLKMEAQNYWHMMLMPIFLIIAPLVMPLSYYNIGDNK